MSFEIVNRYARSVLYASATAQNISEAALEAIKAGAILRRADLGGANLGGAILTDAILTGADLTGANLGGADLTGAVLADADLTPIRDDLWAILCSSPKEVSGLRQALIDGRIDGSVYEGECACLVGTLAKVRGCNYAEIPNLTPNEARPAERFFLAIKPGDTPENSQHAKLAVAWVDEWTANMRGAFTPDAAPEEAKNA